MNIKKYIFKASVVLVCLLLDGVKIAEKWPLSLRFMKQIFIMKPIEIMKIAHA